MTVPVPNNNKVIIRFTQDTYSGVPRTPFIQVQVDVQQLQRFLNTISTSRHFGGDTSSLNTNVRIIIEATI